MLVTAIASSIKKAVLFFFQKLNSTIQKQARQITEPNELLEEAQETKADFQKHIWSLE